MTNPDALPESIMASPIVHRRRYSELCNATMTLKYWRNFRRDAHTRALESLSKHGLDTKHFTLERFSHLMPVPRNYLDKDLLFSYSTFLARLPLLPDTLLQKIIPLRSCNRAIYKMEKDSYVVYLRSFPMPAEVLEMVLNQMEQLGVTNDITHPYRVVLQETEHGKIVTIRYVGATKNQKGPVTRHLSTVSRVRSGLDSGHGIFDKFLKAIIDVAPDVLDHVEIWEVSKVAYGEFNTHPNTASQKSELSFDLSLPMEDHEIYVIALFDFKFLMNTRIGGTSPTFQYKETDITLFQRLGTSVCDKFNRYSHEIPQELKDSLDKLFTEIKNTVNAKLSSYGVSIPLSDKFRECILSAATPVMFNNHVIILYTGQETPVADREANVNFFKSTSPAAKIQRELYRMIDRLESQSILQDDSTRERSMNKVFAWTNLYYWKFQSQYRVAMEFSCRFLTMCNPWLVVTYGATSTAVWLSGFSYPGPNAYQRNLLQHVGIPRLIPRSNGTIAIPAFHPGSEARLGSSADTRVRFLTETAIFVYVDVALEILSVDVSRKNRFETCAKIISVGHKRLLDAGFYDTFDEAKKELSKEMQNRSPHGTCRWEPSPKNLPVIHELKLAMSETHRESPAIEKRPLSEYEVHGKEKASTSRYSTTTKRKFAEEQLSQPYEGYLEEGCHEKRKSTLGVWKENREQPETFMHKENTVPLRNGVASKSPSPSDNLSVDNDKSEDEWVSPGIQFSPMKGALEIASSHGKPVKMDRTGTPKGETVAFPRNPKRLSWLELQRETRRRLLEGDKFTCTDSLTASGKVFNKRIRFRKLQIRVPLDANNETVHMQAFLVAKGQIHEHETIKGRGKEDDPAHRLGIKLTYNTMDGESKTIWWKICTWKTSTKGVIEKLNSVVDFLEG